MNLKWILKLKTDRIRSMLRDAIDLDDKDQVPQHITAAIEEMKLTEEAEILDTAVAYKELRLLEESYDSEIKRLKLRCDQVAAQAERLKTVLKGAVEPGTKFSDERVAIAWRKSTETVVAIAAEELPPRYTRVTIAADKAAIKAALGAGKTIEGCFLKENDNIQIK